MADKKPIFPVGTQVNYPDGSVYIYLQSAQKFNGGDTYVEGNVNNRIVKFKGGRAFPSGIVTERVDKDEYTLVLIQLPKPQPKPTPDPKIEVPSA